MKLFNTVQHLMKLISDEELYILYTNHPIFMRLSNKREEDYTIDEIIEALYIFTYYLDNRFKYIFNILYT